MYQMCIRDSLQPIQSKSGDHILKIRSIRIAGQIIFIVCNIDHLFHSYFLYGLLVYLSLCFAEIVFCFSVRLFPGLTGVPDGQLFKLGGVKLFQYM